MTQPALTPKENMFKALLGKKLEVLPAAPGYLSLFLADLERTHYIEQYRQCMNGCSPHPVEHAEDTHFRAQALVQAYQAFKTAPDWIEVGTGASISWGCRTQIVLRRGNLCYEDKVSGVCVPMHSIPIPIGDEVLSESIPSGQDVWDISGQITSREDVERQMPFMTTDQLLRSGEFDLPRQVVAEYGDQYFISTILDTPYSEMYDYLGFRGLLVTPRLNPEFFQSMLERRLDLSKEVMQAWAETGIHGVYVEEIFSGADAISPQSYDKFVFAYNLPYFQHMRTLGLLPIHYVCGDVIPRLERMVQYDIAAVAVEESKKKFRIEIDEVVERVAGRKAVFGNIDAVHFGIHATPEEMQAEVGRQAEIGRHANGFIVSTGSPFPLETDPRMIDSMISSAHSYNTHAPFNMSK
jgi:hypothetical protein